MGTTQLAIPDVFGGLLAALGDEVNRRDAPGDLSKLLQTVSTEKGEDVEGNPTS